MGLMGLHLEDFDLLGRKINIWGMEGWFVNM